MIRTVTVALGLLVAACDGTVTGPVAPGEWGGDHVGLVLTLGGGELEYDCAEGRMDEPVVQVRGRFQVAGVHWPGQGGPIGVDRRNPRPARYTGTVSGGRMTLMVMLTDTGESLGTFELERGRSPRVVKCL